LLSINILLEKVHTSTNLLKSYLCVQLSTDLDNKSKIHKWLKYLALLNIVAVVLYIVYLNNVVIKSFSKPITTEGYTYSYESQPIELINMLLIIEDQAFFKHIGIDFKEILRVIRDHYLYQKPIRGASTITQQLIKNTLLSREQTMSRKLKEAIMATLLELSFEKEYILNRYMNTVYLGQDKGKSINGFANASYFYFSKPIESLSLEEMASLVALLKGPSYFNPDKYPQRLRKRTKLVLSLYKKYKKIVN